MAACSTVTDWVRTNVWQPVDEWVTKQEKKCKKRSWWDPRRWLCWLVTHLVLAVVWVVVAVVVAVVTVVCTVVFDVLGILWDLLKFFGHLFLALVTWDKCRLDEAVSDLLDALLTLVAIIGHVVIRPIVNEVQIYRLRRYVKHQIAQRYFTQPDVVPRLWQAFNVDSGVFGYHVTAAVHRMYVDSQTLTKRFGDVPNLFSLHDQGLVNLYELAGFDRDCSVFSAAGWYRPRHQTAVYPFASGGGGFGDPTPPELKREQLDEYIRSRGTAGPHFRIYAISPGNLDTRCDTVVEYGRQLGLLFDIERHEKEVTDEQYLSYSPAVHVPFLIDGLGRADKTKQPSQAMMQLCDPAAVAVFGFSDGSLRGWTANLIGTTGCVVGRDLPSDNASGVSFIDDIPDWIRRYVLIHELGHYFGLCHVDGFDRIMVSGKPGQGDLLTWAAAPNFLFHGGPRFIYTESQRVWDFIIDNFPPECLAPDGGVIL